MVKEKRYIDLHCHTTCSDGEQTVSEVIDAAYKQGMKAIALTDHNCFAIYEPRREKDMSIIPGCEFSVKYTAKNGKNKEIHIIGLFFDGADPALNSLFEGIDKLAYVKAILRQLEDLGMHITLEEIRNRFPDAEHIGRQQIAALLVSKGYAKDITDAFDSWIGNFSPYYLDPIDFVTYVPMEKCVRAITEANGLAILAHPFHYRMNDAEVEELIRDFRRISDGPMGIEVYYWKYIQKNMRLVKYLEEKAVKYDLLPSAASDRHHADLPFVEGDPLLLENMIKAMAEEKRKKDGLV